MNTLQQLETKIRTLVPSLQELTFGCEFKLKNQDDGGWRFRAIKIIKGQRCLAYEVGRASPSYIPFSNIEILGHPILLHHVLQAIGINKSGELCDIQIYSDGSFKLSFPNHDIGFPYNPSLPFSQQSKECHEFLLSILNN